MSDLRLQRQAQILVRYSLAIKKGDRLDGELFCKDGQFVV